MADEGRWDVTLDASRPEDPVPPHCSLAAPLEIITRIYGSTSTVTVAGELDLAVAGDLSAALHRVLADAPEMVLLDLSALSFIDVAGVRAVQRACERAHARSAHLTIVPAPDRVQRVFKLTGIEPALPFAPGTHTARRTERRPRSGRGTALARLPTPPRSVRPASPATVSTKGQT